MRVAIIHNAVTVDAPADERDVLVQAASVAGALERLGHSVEVIPVTLNLASMVETVQDLNPAVAFNLVEALGGTDQLSPAVPLLLKVLGIPCTGNDGDALHITNSKRLSKQVFRASQIPTPAAIYCDRSHAVSPIGTPDFSRPSRYLLKALHEHASFGMDDNAVITASSIKEVVAAITQRSQQFRKPFFAEAFIEGREFNLSVLDRGDGSPEVLPPAEIRFDTYPEGKPRIVGYAAKWEAESFEYNETPRRFEFGPEDESLLRGLRRLAENAWEALHLSGYARVDFRVDEQGQPWVIEANANPCLSPDAGFAAALETANVSYDEAVRRILAAALPADRG